MSTCPRCSARWRDGLFTAGCLDCNERRATLASHAGSRARTPTGSRLIAYIGAVRSASERAYPGNMFLADSWHMGWVARRVGRARTEDHQAWGHERVNAWLCGWDAARGAWSEVGENYMPEEV